MADIDPTRPTASVSLEIGRRDRKFLRELFEMARGGAHEELHAYGRRLSDPGALRRELVAYDRLLEGLDRQRLTPDPDVVAVLGELAEVVDEGNEYRRAAAEHEALRNLIASLERPRDACARRSAPCAAIRCRGDGPPSCR